MNNNFNDNKQNIPNNKINNGNVANEWEAIADNINKTNIANYSNANKTNMQQDYVPKPVTNPQQFTNNPVNDSYGQQPVLKSLQNAKAAQNSNQKVVISTNMQKQQEKKEEFRVNIDESFFSNDSNKSQQPNVITNQVTSGNSMKQQVPPMSAMNGIKQPVPPMSAMNGIKQPVPPMNGIMSGDNTNQINQGFQNNLNQNPETYKNIVQENDEIDSEKLNTKDKIIIYSLGIASALIVLVTLVMLFSVLFEKKNIGKKENTNTNTTSESSNNKENSYDVSSSFAETDDSSITSDDVIADNESKNINDSKEPLTNMTIDNNKDELTIVFGGDVLFSDSMINSYNKNGGKVTNIMAQNLLDEFKSADIAMINEEFPFSTRGEKMEDKQYTFRADPTYSKILKEMNISIVSLANNHILDFGVDALLDTFTTLNDAKVMYAGAGKNLSEAKETKYIDVDGIKTAFLSASRVIPVSSWGATSNTPGVFTTYDATALVSEIKKAEEKADISVVYVHWGTEHEELPEDYQVNLAKKYIDAGADVVIGCHTHCLQGMEYYKGKPIVYSMGNFMFGDRVDQTMMLKVKVDKKLKLSTQVLPCSSSSYCTKLITDKEAKKSFYDYYSGISFDTNFDENGYVVEE